MTTPNPTDSEVTEGLEPCPLAHVEEKGLHINSSSGMRKWHITCFDCGLYLEGMLDEPIRSLTERWNTRVRASVAAPPGDAQLVDLIDRQALLSEIHKSAETCRRGAEDRSKPEGFRKMMEHFAEAGRQFIEMIEERRYSGPISAQVCEGCMKPTVVVQVTDDDVVLCPLCYAATPITTLDDRIQCPHCHWRPSPELKPVNGSYKCANCDFSWEITQDATPSPVTPSTTQAGEVSAAPGEPEQPSLEFVCIAPSEAPLVINLWRGLGTSEDQKLASLHVNLCLHCQELLDRSNAAAPLAAPVGDRDAKFPPSALIQGIVERAGKARAELAELLQVPAVWPEILSAVRQRVVAAPVANDAEELARQIVGTVFDNTGASHETLKQVTIERITDAIVVGHISPPGSISDSVTRAAEEIAANYEVHKDRCHSNERYPSPPCDCGAIEEIAATISKHFAATPADNDAEG